MTFLRLPGQSVSASAARSHLRTELAGWGRSSVVDDALLLISELVTNAVVHGRSDVTVVVDLTERWLRVEVGDDSPTLPVLRSSSPSALGGRGVALVEAYADRWGVDAGADNGKFVWFELSR